MMPRTLLNINFPSVEPNAVGGIKTVRQGFHDYGRSSIIEGTDPRGFPYYWFGLGSGIHTPRSEEHTSELQSLMRISYAVFCLKTKTQNRNALRNHITNTISNAQIEFTRINILSIYHNNVLL